MPLKKTMDYILESWLPTKLTILIAGSTILLTLLAIGLPEYLQKIDILLTEERRLLLRIVAPLGLLFLGTFSVLLLVLNHGKSGKEHNINGTEKHIKIEALSYNQVKVLDVFIKLDMNEVWDYDIQKRVGLNTLKLSHALSLLTNNNIIKCINIDDNDRLYRLTPQGLEITSQLQS